MNWVSKSLKRARKYSLAWLLVCLPTAIASLYYGLLASDVYISESKFLVRAPQRSQSSTVVGALLQGTGFSRAQDDAYSVQEYMLSRDAMASLDNTLGIKAAYGKTAIDLLNRFPTPLTANTNEEFFKHYQKYVSVEYDPSSSVTSVRVRAYSAELSQKINEGLLTLGERLLNETNIRARNDLIRFAQNELTTATKNARDASGSIAQYRSRKKIYDPDKQSLGQLQLVGKLQDELISTTAQFDQFKMLSPDNPQIPLLRKKRDNLEKQISKELDKISGENSNSYSSKSGEFDRLALERGIADKQLASALSALETAQNEARRKQLYLERIVQPSKPDSAVEPRRFRSVVAVLITGLLLWGIISMLIAGAKEHQN